MEQNESQQPANTNETKRVNCEICGSYVAKLFIDLSGKRIYICQQDANTLLRMACKLEQLAMTNTLKFVEQQIYGNE